MWLMSQTVDGPTMEDVVALLNRSGAAEEPNEEISGLTILIHGLQCAAILRRHHPHDVELQMAGLLHDVGHLLAPGRQDLHGRAAADYVAPVFGERVAALIDGHVPAKRYLITAEPTYWSGLSMGSRRTLETQGGAMTPAEVAAFRSSLHLEQILELRRADDAAKDPTTVVPTLETWLPVLEGAAR
jgi:predicted HD phosphohydrolase